MRGRKLLGGAVVVAVFLGAVVVAFGFRGERDSAPWAPFPSDADIARNGFAVWPVDTPAEAREECDGAPGWRTDPKEVALRFASEVMGYPDPGIDSDLNSHKHIFRALVNSRGVKGVFLGSMLEVSQFGECWYLTEGQPREGGDGINVVTTDDSTKLVVPTGCCGQVVEVGWGDWIERLESKERREVLLDIPDEAKGAPGHYLITDFDEDGISEGVRALPLPAIPDGPKKQALQPLDVGPRPEDKKLCRMAWARREKLPQIIRDLRRIFSDGLKLDGGYLRFDSRSQRRLGSDLEWRLGLDEADFRLSFSRVDERCWIIRSIVPRGQRIIRSVSADERSFTFDLDPARAHKVLLYFGVGGEVSSGSVRTRAVFRRPFRVARGSDVPPRNEDLPAFVLAITYRGGNMYSAEYRLFDSP